MPVGFLDMPGESMVKSGRSLVDSRPLSVKQVPRASAPYAEIKQIGGMSRKCTNLWDGVFLSGGYADNTGEVTTQTDRVRSANNIRVAPSTKYYFAVRTSYARVFFLDATGAYLSAVSIESGTFTTPSNCYYVKFYWVSPTCAAGDVIFNEGADRLPYETYFSDLRKASVTEVRVVGRNLLNIEGETFADVFGLDENSWFITAGNGMVIFSLSDTRRYTFTSKNNHISVTNYNSTQWHWLSRLVKLRPNTTYRLQCNGIHCIMVGLYSTAEGSQGTELTVGTDGTFYSGNYAYWMISFYSTGEADVMITEGDDPVEFAPYVSSSLHIPTEVRSLDGYGRGLDETCYNYIDFEKKQYVKKVGAVNLGTLLWSYHGNSTNGHYFSANFSGGAPIDGKVLCAAYRSTTAYYINNTPVNKAIGIEPTYISIRDTEYANSNDLKAALSGVNLIYELETPEVTDISDLLSVCDALPIGIDVSQSSDMQPVRDSVRMVNSRDYDVPNTLAFYENKNGVLAADTFVGDLVGTALHARRDIYGRPIDVSAYAPAGHGLGDVTMKFFRDANDAIFSGWYSLPNNALNGPGQQSLLRVDSDITIIDQTAYMLDGGIKCRRGNGNSSSGVTFGEWVDCSPSAFAPAGFGYGDMPKKILDTADDATGSLLENALENELAKMSNSTVKQILFYAYPNITGGYCIGTFHRHDANNAVLTGVNYNTAAGSFIKRKYNGVWSPLEWINPPMIANGTEYRTTKRHDGKAVYAKLVPCGTAVNGAYVDLPHGTTCLVSHQGILDNMTMPVGDSVRGENYAFSYYSTSGAQRLVLSTDSVYGNGSHTWKEQLWYTKD